jgi:DNA-binding MarR family transcriptional regulator
MAAMMEKQGISGTRRRPRVSVGSTTAESRRNKEAAGAAPSDATAPLVPPAGRCNGTAIRRAMRRVSQIYDEAWPHADCSTQKSVLDSIARAGRPTMGEIAASLVLDRSALAHNIKPLEREGLVEVVADEHDKRNRLVALTEAGRAKLAQSMPLWEEAQTPFRARVRRGEGESVSSNIGLHCLAGVCSSARLQIIGAVAMFLDLGSDAFRPGNPAASAPIE